jgi:hypothetical protein
MSEINRQLHKKLVLQRKTLKSHLKSDDNFYYGIRNNTIIKIKKVIKL